MKIAYSVVVCSVLCFLLLIVCVLKENYDWHWLIYNHQKYEPMDTLVSAKVKECRFAQLRSRVENWPSRYIDF